MINGVGVDIVALHRFTDRLARKILCEEELFIYEQFTSIPQRQAFAAGRWAAKEAVCKALHSGFHMNLTPRHICIVNNAQGVPLVKIIPPYTSNTIHLSISHTSEYACAFAVATR